MTAKGRFSYERDTYLLSHKHGYPDPYTLIKTEYLKGTPASEIGNKIDKTSNAVLFHLKNMGVELRPRGGRNNNPRGINQASQFIVLCRKCGKKIKATSFHKLQENMKVHKCKGGRK